MALPGTELLARLEALADAFPRQAYQFGSVDDNGIALPLYAFPFGDLTRPVTVVAAGVHGDEPEGVLCLLDWLTTLAARGQTGGPSSLLVLPCLNPAGLQHGKRANAAGQDINRQFHADTTPETTAVRALLAPLPLLAIIDLHTDPRASGFYLFQLLQEGIPGQAHFLQEALLAQNFGLEPRPSYAGYVGSEGLFSPSPTQIADYARRAPGLGLAEWGWHLGAPYGYVFETPQSAGLDRAVQMHTVALKQLISRLSGSALTAE